MSSLRIIAFQKIVLKHQNYLQEKSTRSSRIFTSFLQDFEKKGVNNQTNIFHTFFIVFNHAGSLKNIGEKVKEHIENYLRLLL
jgi:hypothetical protein